jgi:hypothetical protein
MEVSKRGRFKDEQEWGRKCFEDLGQRRMGRPATQTWSTDFLLQEGWQRLSAGLSSAAPWLNFRRPGSFYSIIPGDPRYSVYGVLASWVFGCPDSWVYCTLGSSDSSAHLDLRNKHPTHTLCVDVYCGSYGSSVFSWVARGSCFSAVYDAFSDSLVCCGVELGVSGLFQRVTRSVCLLLQDLLQSCSRGGEEESGGHVL